MHACPLNDGEVKLSSNIKGTVISNPCMVEEGYILRGPWMSGVHKQYSYVCVANWINFHACSVACTFTHKSIHQQLNHCQLVLYDYFIRK